MLGDLDDPVEAQGVTPPGPPGSEVERLSRWWRELPLARAHVRAPVLREQAQRYVDELASRAGTAPTTLADLGPAVSMDQLLAAVCDVRQMRLRDLGPAGARTLDEELSRLRRRLS